MITAIRLTIVSVLICTISGCYSFKGVSIPEETTSFYVQDFEISNRALKAPRQLGTVFTDQFKRKVLRESRLNFTETAPDIEFAGEISRFAIRSVAPQPDETTSFSRLDIAIKVDYTDHLNEENNWSKSFSDFRNFDQNVNFLDVQDQLVKEIFEQISEDIFNETFSNW
ncbi:hypothetical protein KUV50_16100 [Membranicola marinus]|uniref:Lipopolysaccharide-assembly n=1 Tax=Membranihabitans marinus TaxID=1227546 RepID=A0A953HQ20_9BACT|nr:LPS assembly lipoprotein LptE [Membranihabitans marinus]MBY5959677.1 hypothetical protein [Membranihabitans marinus]